MSCPTSCPAALYATQVTGPLLPGRGTANRRSSPTWTGFAWPVTPFDPVNLITATSEAAAPATAYWPAFDSPPEANIWVEVIPSLVLHTLPSCPVGVPSSMQVPHGPS